MSIIKGAPFRYKGAINVENCKTSEEVIKTANLDWEVGKCELVAEMLPIHSHYEIEGDSFLYGGAEYTKLDNFYATYRKDTNIPLGVVKGKYTPVQNIKAFEFFDAAIGPNKAIWQTAGFFGKGERMFVSAKLPNTILVKGDPVETYLVFTNSHDGSNGVKILFTPIRVVCENSLTAAINSTSNYVSFRHTQSVHNKLEIAKDLLNICKIKAEECKSAYTILAAKEAKDEQVKQYLCDNVLTSSEIDALISFGYSTKHIIDRNFNAIEAANISMRKVNILTNMYKYYFDGPGQKEFVGTWWGAVNAITGYYSNIDTTEGTKRMDSILYGDKARKINTAFNQAIQITTN